MSKSEKQLVDQSQALDDFFSSLMRDVEAYAEEEQHDSQAIRSDDLPSAPAVVQAESVSPKPVMSETTSQQDVQLEEPVSTKIFEQLPPVVEPEPEVSVAEVEIQPEPEPEPEPKHEAGIESAPEKVSRPDWSESEFQAMLFNVAGLMLAVPLVDLNGVVEWDPEKITEMPGHAEFYLGLMNHLGVNVPVIDTARLVLPPKKRQELTGDDPTARLSRVVLIHDGQYGLACDEVSEVITLQPDEVRWRTARTQRRWLAGTVVEHMCALIDVNAFADLLASRAPVSAFRE